MRGLQLALVLVALTLFAVALAGCTASGSGTASVYVKDAPTDEFDEIHVVFERVEVHRSGNGTENEGGWITIYENATGQDVDLLDASGDRAAFLGEADLDAGRYQQIRIHATEAYGIQNGSRVDFQLAPTPLKVVRSFEVEDGGETRIILDFDLDNSIVQMGPNGYRMTPVIGQTTTEVVDGDDSGAEAHGEGEVVEVA